MTAPLCLVCDQRPSVEGFACTGCSAKATGRLRAICDLAPDARLVAAGLVRRGGSSSGGKPGSRPPLNDGATDALAAIQGTLTTLARDVAETRGLQVPDAGRLDPIVVAAQWLMGQVEWLRHASEGAQAWAPGAYGEIQDCAGRLRGLVNGPSEQRFLGPCGADIGCCADPACRCEPGECACTPSGPCAGDVYAILGATHGRCRTCRTEVATRDRQAWLDGEVRKRAFSADDIADAYGVSVKTIKSWATERAEVRNAEGKLVRSATPVKLWPHAHDRDGEPLYLVAHVLDLAAADAARRAEQQAKRARKVTESEAAAAERAAREVGYMGVHQRLRRDRGPANEQLCATCGQQASDWAYDHSDPNQLIAENGPYSQDPAHYQPLCRSCHQSMDKRFRAKL